MRYPRSFLVVVASSALAICTLPFFVLKPPRAAAAEMLVEIKRSEVAKPGGVELIFLLGAGPDLENLGSNYQVRSEGWIPAFQKTFVPRIQEFYGGRAPPGSRVWWHLPCGRSETASGDDAEMPFDAVNRAKAKADLAREAGNKTKAAEFDRLSDMNAFCQGLRVCQLKFGIEPCVYLGTVDHGHAAQWSAMDPSEFASSVEEILRPFTTVPGCRIFLDAGAVKGPNSNSWQVRLIAQRMGLKFGSEPTPSIDGPQWANDPDLDYIITAQAFDNPDMSWRLAPKGRTYILDNVGKSDEHIARWCLPGNTAVVGGYSIKWTHAQWATKISAAAGTVGGDIGQ